MNISIKLVNHENNFLLFHKLRKAILRCSGFHGYICKKIFLHECIIKNILCAIIALKCVGNID